MLWQAGQDEGAMESPIRIGMLCFFPSLSLFEVVVSLYLVVSFKKFKALSFLNFI